MNELLTLTSTPHTSNRSASSQPVLQRITMLVYEGTNLIDLGGPLQAFQAARSLMQSQGAVSYELVVASAQGGLIATEPGLAVMTRPVASLNDSRIDTIVVAGGVIPTDGVPAGKLEFPPSLAQWVAEHAPRARRICSVCTGVFVLAAAGVLDGKRATTHWYWAALLANQYPQIQVDSTPVFIHDGAVWTSAGSTAGIDLALALIEEDCGHRVAIATARALVVFLKRPGGQAQYSAPLAAQIAGDKAFDDLHAWMATHLNADLRVERLAEHVGMSPRTFARLYAAQTGTTPARRVEVMRLEAACRALTEMRTPLKRIAIETGFGDEQTLRRSLLRRFGVGPAQYRSRFSGQK